VKYVNFRFVVGAQGVKLLRPTSCWEPKFFAYLLGALDLPDRGYSRHFQFVRKLLFPLPPLLEQDRIVAAIEEQFTRLDAAVASLVRARANLKRYRAAVLAVACSGRLVPTEAALAREEGRAYEDAHGYLTRLSAERQRRLRFASSGNTRMSDGAMELVPEGWASATVTQLVGSDGVFVDGDWVESKDQDPAGDVRLVQLADIGVGEYRNRSSRFLTLAKAVELRCTFLVAGDVLVARMPDPLGRSCIFPGDPKRCVTVVDICIVRTGRDGVDHRWLALTLNSPQISAKVSALQSGSTRKRISRGNLATIALPLPPLAEQRRIVAEVERRLSIVDDMEASVAASLKRAERLRQAVLRRAFAGELVPQDPSDEPAGALLERVRAERAAVTAVSPSRRGCQRQPADTGAS